MIISTRSNVIASETSARIEFQPRANVGREALGIFLGSAGLTEETIHENKSEELVKKLLELCGGVPLMLSIAGARVWKSRGTPKASLKYLLSSLEKEGISLSEQLQPNYPSCFNQTVETCLNTIADTLESSIVKREMG